MVPVRYLMLILFTSVAILISPEDLPPDAIEPSTWPRSTTVNPTPDPFSLMWYDAQHAAALIRRAGLLVHRGPGGRETIAVRSVEIVEVGPVEDLPPAHRRRWDLILNGEPLDWSNTYIEWGGELTNLQLLFTYRNQRPVPEAPFVLE